MLSLVGRIREFFAAAEYDGREFCQSLAPPRCGSNLPYGFALGWCMASMPAPHVKVWKLLRDRLWRAGCPSRTVIVEVKTIAPKRPEKPNPPARRPVTRSVIGRERQRRPCPGRNEKKRPSEIPKHESQRLAFRIPPDGK